MQRICTVCKEAKDTTEFFAKDKSKGWLHSQCKSCYKTKRLSFMEEHYAKYGDAYRARARIRKAAIKKIRQEQLYEYLQGKACENCGFNDMRALDFDHQDPKTKRFGIARAITNCYAWEEILCEINKCKLLCANCHRIRTAQQQNWRKGRLGGVVTQGSAKP
jgi:hypothetical protein